ncbi:hypothetical protein RI367_007375 [Sorochytrium milnesiophthora]
MLSTQRQRVKSLTITEQASLTIVKQLISTSVSCITYIRGLFPEDNYELHEYSDVALKMLKRDFSEENNRILNVVCFLHILEYGVFEAIEKQYLRTLEIGILRDPQHHPDNIIESYRFNVQYPQLNAQSGTATTAVELEMSGRGGVHSATTPIGETAAAATPMTVAQVKRQTIQMIRTLILTLQTLSDLPDACFLTMEVDYYDDRTPEDYEPRFFESSTHQSRLFFAEPVKFKATVGKVSSNYHEMQLTVSSLAEETTSSQPHPNEQPPQRSRASQNSAAEEGTNSKEGDLECRLRDTVLRSPPPTVRRDSATDLSDAKSCTKESNSSLVEETPLSQSGRPMRRATQITKTPAYTPPSQPRHQATAQKKSPRPKKAAAARPGKAESPTAADDDQAEVMASATAAPEKNTDNQQDGTDDDGESNAVIDCDDAALVQCDKCSSWSHVVCHGYYHAKDERLREVEFECHRCNERMREEDQEALRRLAMFRTVISVVWQKEDAMCTDYVLLSELRIDARNYSARLVEEGIASWRVPPAKAHLRPRRYAFSVVKDSNAKTVIRRFFTQDLRVALDANAVTTVSQQSDATQTQPAASQASTQSQPTQPLLQSQAAPPPPPPPPPSTPKKTTPLRQATGTATSTGARQGRKRTQDTEAVSSMDKQLKRPKTSRVQAIAVL